MIYTVNNSDYGQSKDGEWTGMVGDIISGAADLIVGAFSITSERLKVKFHVLELDLR